MITTHLLVKGKVQGVFFRASAKEVAIQNGITGWIKNNKEGDVEAMITGTNEQVEKFTNWCRQGPPKAVVDEVIITPKEEMHFNTFDIIRF
ncbi:MAG TPA: acylphosphatase [Chitinophagaceae bacterium]